MLHELASTPASVVFRLAPIVPENETRNSVAPAMKAVARDLLREAGRTLGTDPEPGHGYFFRSDHFPLAKAGVPAVSISDSTQFIGKDEGFAKRMREEYTDKRYHQPSDEFDPAWDMSGAVADLKLLTRLGWRVAALPDMPAYHAGEQFAQPRLRKPN